MQTITPPRIYFEWVEVFDMLIDKTDDNAVLQALQQGTIEWQLGVSERFSNKMIDSVNVRLKAATEKFSRDFDNAYGQESYISQALLSFRKEMAFLFQVVDLPAIPEKDRIQYCDMIRTQADAIQGELENFAKTERTGKLENIFRNHRVNGF